MGCNDKLLHILKKLPHKQQVKFALYCANDVRHRLTDERSIKALDTVAKWLEGKATDKEVEDATNAAIVANFSQSFYNTAALAAHNATNDAYHAALYAAESAYASYYAAYNAARYYPKPETKLLEYYNTLLSSLTNFEKELYNITIEEK